MSFFRDSLAIHAVFVGRNWSFNSFFKISHVSIFGRPATTSSLDLVRHQSFALPDRYMVVIINCSPIAIQAAMKYCSMSQWKFSKSSTLCAPLKGLSQAFAPLQEANSRQMVSPTPLLASATQFPPLEFLSAPGTLLSLPTLCHGGSPSVLQRPSRMSPSNLVASRAARRLQQAKSKGLCSPQLLCLSPHQALTLVCLPWLLSLLLAPVAHRSSLSQQPSVALIPTVTRPISGLCVRRPGTC